MKLNTKRRTALAAAVTLMVATASQAIGISPASAASDVKLGITGNQTGAVPAGYAVQKGILAKNGLNGQVVVLPPPALVPQLQAGQVDFAYMPLLQALQARTNAGMDLRIITASDGISPNDAARAQNNKTYASIVDPSGFCVSPDIKTVKDLEGKTLGVGTRGGFPEAALGAVMQKGGADPKKVQWAVIGSTDMVPAIKAGKIAGGYTGSGFTPSCEANGLKLLASPTVVLLGAKGGPITGWVTTAKYAKEHPKEVAAFQKAMYQTAAQLRNKNNMKEAITISTQYTKAPLDSALATRMPFYYTTLTKPAVQTWANILQRTGLVVKPVDVPGILYKQPKM